MGVELGESFPAEQDALQSLLSDYSFHDAAIGVVSLAWSIYYFGALGKNHVNVLTLLAVAVVAGLNQEVCVCLRGARLLSRAYRIRLKTFGASPFLPGHIMG